MKLSEIKKDELSLKSLHESFHPYSAMEIYGINLLSETALRESNSKETIQQINLLYSEKPVVGKYYYGLHFALVNDEVHPGYNFHGKVVNIEQNNYTVEFKDGSKHTYSDDLTRQIPARVLFQSSKHDHDVEKFNLGMTHNVTFINDIKK